MKKALLLLLILSFTLVGCETKYTNSYEPIDVVDIYAHTNSHNVIILTEDKILMYEGLIYDFFNTYDKNSSEPKSLDYTDITQSINLGVNEEIIDISSFYQIESTGEESNSDYIYNDGFVFLTNQGNLYEYYIKHEIESSDFYKNENITDENSLNLLDGEEITDIYETNVYVHLNLVIETNLGNTYYLYHGEFFNTKQTELFNILDSGEYVVQGDYINTQYYAEPAVFLTTNNRVLMYEGENSLSPIDITSKFNLTDDDKFLGILQHYTIAHLSTIITEKGRIYNVNNLLDVVEYTSLEFLDGDEKIIHYSQDRSYAGGESVLLFTNNNNIYMFDKAPLRWEPINHTVEIVNLLNNLKIDENETIISAEMIQNAPGGSPFYININGSECQISYVYLVKTDQRILLVGKRFLSNEFYTLELNNWIINSIL